MIRTLVYIWIPLVVVAVALVNRKPIKNDASSEVVTALEKTQEDSVTID
jgi:hypothetical protein